MVFERHIEKNLFTPASERTVIDKLLSKEDGKRLKELISKPGLKHEELLEMSYLISGTETKLYNLDEWNRYLILKFYVWIREFFKIAEISYSHKEMLEEKESKGTLKLSERTRRIIRHNENLIEYNSKFLAELYLAICRTTLSLGATGFMELLKNKFEMSYPIAPTSTNNPEEKSGGFRMFGTKKGE